MHVCQTERHLTSVTGEFCRQATRTLGKPTPEVQNRDVRYSLELADDGMMIHPYRLGIRQHSQEVYRSVKSICIIPYSCRMIDTDATKLIRCLAELPVLLAAVAAGDGFPGCQQPLATFLEIDSKSLGIPLAKQFLG